MPENEPESFEKNAVTVLFKCKATERRRWLSLWPKGQFSAIVRQLLNEEAWFIERERKESADRRVKELRERRSRRV